MSRESQAGDWFARMRSRDAEKHRAKFDEWIADPDNAAAYAEAERRWAVLDDSSTKRVLARAPRETGTPRLRWATALLVAVALTFGAVWYMGQTRNGTQIATTALDRDTILLADGTLVKLLGEAKLEALFSDRERKVIMSRGRARFTVAHDASRPFRVVIGDSEVVALGTIFEVDLTRSHPIVRLVSGSADVRSTGPGGSSVRLRPGEAAEVRDSEPRRIAVSDLTPDSVAPPTVSPVAATAPPSLVVADKMPLGDVVNRANRVNSLPIRLADPVLGSLEVTGRFDVSDSASLARKLAAAFGLTVERTSGEIILKKV